MKRAIVLATVVLAFTPLAVASPAGAGGRTAKVTRSHVADAGEYPAQVGLLNPANPDNYQAQFCGGTLIHPEWVLTAAHCTEGVPFPDVLLGTEKLDGSGTRVATTEVRVPDNVSFPTNDIALLRLAAPSAVAPALLAYDGMEALEAPGTAAVVTGWGGLKGDETNQEFPMDLQEGDVPVISDADCDAALAAYNDHLTDPPGQVCAGSGNSSSNPEEADACRGDSGGPLWVTGPDGARRQIGLVSGGPTCGFSPTYYTSVEAFLGFIELATGLQLASFTDIPTDAHEQNIERVTLNAFASGLGGGLFGPSQSVSRGQMATFLARALRLQPQPTGPFTDVAGTPHEQSINAIAGAGIAGGFPDGTYRPSELVTRAQMATFLANALQLEPVATGPFSDTAGDPHEGDINAIAAAGVAGGFSDGTYKPLNGVTRGQMSTFLARAFLGA